MYGFQSARVVWEELVATLRSARILYIIATTFHLPPRAINTLRQALELYHQSLESTTATLRRIDAGYNLAVGLAQLADWTEEGFGEGDEAEVRRTREKAVGLLMDVATAQEAYLATNQEEDGEGDIGEVADGADEESDDGATTYEEHVPTTSALVETLFEIVDITTSIWAALASLDSLPPQMTPHAMDQLLQRSLQLAESTGDVSLARMAHIKRLEVALILIKFSETDISALVDQIKAVWQAATAKDSKVDDETRIACAEVLINASTYLAYRATDAQQSWQHLSSATQVATMSLEIPAKLTVAPLWNASTLFDLATLSLRRALVCAAFSGLCNRQSKRQAADSRTRRSSGLEAALLTTGLPPVTGWDRESLARTTVLTLFRTLYHQASLLSDASAQTKAETLLTRLRDLRRTEAQERSLTSRDVQRFVEMLEDDEGQMHVGERQFWKDFVQKLEA
ncbi:hypothetical protein QFC20_006209 [Naganishia adeliensis]|uniref:Uncharacterized protein n=1 Tax=Naganishia adeliensis TaxID=92952 RepID=A0ACC2VE55_9TREE|nr:hypothetical protein QFC20_006209 [Naganishia adeliensis]